MRKRIAILSLSILAVCMLLTACNEKNAANGDGYPESPENITIGMTTDEVSQEQKESSDTIRETTERSYDSFRDFPHGNMEYIDETAYAFLKDMYAGIEYKSEVEQGDLAVYDEYICKYEELLNNEITFAIPQTGEEYYVEDYVDMHSFFLNAEADYEVFNPHGFIYYLFDMDMDGTPELCMYNFKTYIFKYDKEGDSVILWKLIESPNETIHGSLSLRWNWDGLRYTYCELNPEAELTLGVYFMNMEKMQPRGWLLFPHITTKKKRLIFRKR